MIYDNQGAITVRFFKKMDGILELLLDGRKSAQNIQTRSLPESRKTITRQITIGVSISITIFAFGWFLLPAGMETDFPSHIEKLVYTLRWQLFSLMTLLYSVKQVADSRFSSKAIDPVYGSSEHLLIFDTKILQNTLEQVVLNISVQWILTTYLSLRVSNATCNTIIGDYICSRKDFILYWLP